MKENVLDVLMYLFEHYADDEADSEPDRDTLEQNLLEAGFPNGEIEKAFAWLETLVDEDFAYREGGTARSIRVYTTDETNRLSMESRGFLLYLEQRGILNPNLREMVIERVMALDADEIDLEQLKWVVLMVLFNHPDQEATQVGLEDVMRDFEGAPLH